MRTLIISDVHLGAPYFKKRYKLLYLLLKRWDKIIVNGDLYELLGGFEKNKIEKEYAYIFDILNSDKVIKIEGNHDIGCGIKDYFIILPNGKKIGITHGHKYDKDAFKSLGVKINIFLYNILGFEVRRILKPFKDYSESIQDIIDDYRSKCDYLVLGHTHKPGIQGNVYNSGDWIEHNTYIEINDNNIELKSL